MSVPDHIRGLKKHVNTSMIRHWLASNKSDVLFHLATSVGVCRCTYLWQLPPSTAPRMWLRALSAESPYRTGPSVWICMDFARYVPICTSSHPPSAPSTLFCRATSAIVHVDDLHPWRSPTVVPQTCQDRQMSTSKLQSRSVTIPRNLGSRENTYALYMLRTGPRPCKLSPFRV